MTREKEAAAEEVEDAEEVEEIEEVEEPIEPVGKNVPSRKVKTQQDAHDATPRRDRHRTPKPHVFSPAMSLDDSPATVVSSTFSTTPRNIYSQTGSSLTPTRMPARSVATHSPSIHHQVDDYYEVEEQDEHTWGDDAVLRWEGVDSVNSEDDISSVAPEESGVSDDDEENWGRDAIIDFTYASQESGTEAEEEVETLGEEQFEEVEAVELGSALDDAWSSIPVEADESPAQLMARGMPDYLSWDDNKLQVGQCTSCCQADT